MRFTALKLFLVGLVSVSAVVVTVLVTKAIPLSIGTSALKTSLGEPALLNDKWKQDYLPSSQTPSENTNPGEPSSLNHRLEQDYLLPSQTPTESTSPGDPNHRLKQGAPTESTSPGEPMVLSLSYWEQYANAFGNLMDLQCWARKENISKVLEPSITPKTDDKSVLHFTGGKKDSYFTLGDMVNLTNWNAISVGRHFSPLVSMENFLANASKRIIYVNIKYGWWPTNCETNSTVTKKVWYQFLAAKGFRLHRVVCIDLTSAPHLVSTESFREQIFGGTKHNVSLVFNIWRGIRKSDRVAINDTKCTPCFGASQRVERKPIKSAVSYSNPKAVPLHSPSLRVQTFIDKFVSRHLHGDRYVAVMLRTEKLHKNILSAPNSCVTNIHTDWREIISTKNVTQTLFFTDIGDHGSMKWNNVNAHNFSQSAHDSLQLTMSLQEMNTALEEITSSKNSAQIAFLHQQLVARATCVILVGGGGFQSQTINFYLRTHQGRECYSWRNRECESMYVQRVYG